MNIRHKKIKAGVIGSPINHSLSPCIHNFWLKKYGINCFYEAIEVKENELEKFFKNLSKEGFAGVNVTVPYKQKVSEYLDKLSERAINIGAVNTVIVKKDGSLFGDNTDSYGFIENLKDQQPIPKKINENDIAIVIGAGGAARAIIVGLLDAGFLSIKIVNRTRENAENLVEYLGGAIEVVNWNDRNDIIENAVILVNTTTLGMIGEPTLNIRLNKLPCTAVVVDIVYSPLETELLKKANFNGNPTVNGIGMLLHQARPAFESWFGFLPSVTEELRKHVLTAQKNVN